VEDDSVSIKSISQYEFDQLLPLRSVLELFTGEHVEFYTNVAENVIGAVDHGRVAGEWSYVLLKRDTAGKFRVCDQKAGLKSQPEAKAALLTLMDEAGEDQDPHCSGG
jgi:hypothetical protein